MATTKKRFKVYDKTVKKYRYFTEGAKTIYDNAFVGIVQKDGTVVLSDKTVVSNLLSEPHRFIRYAKKNLKISVNALNFKAIDFSENLVSFSASGATAPSGFSLSDLKFTNCLKLQNINLEAAQGFDFSKNAIPVSWAVLKNLRRLDFSNCNLKSNDITNLILSLSIAVSEGLGFNRKKDKNLLLGGKNAVLDASNAAVKNAIQLLRVNGWTLHVN